MNERLVRSIKLHPVKFAHILGFDKLTDLHNDWIRAMLLEPNDYTLLGHRGSYKTTCLSVAIALLIVLRPDRTIFFIRKTDDDVIEIVTQIQKILQSDLFAYIVREIYGVDLQLTTASAYKVDTNLNRGNRGQVQMQGMGLKGSITGKHADYVFTDDIVNISDRVSRAERETTKLKYQELCNIVNRGGRIFSTGTPWHKEDAISTLMPNVHQWSVYDTGLIDEAKQADLRGRMTPSLYAANYELRHIADADALFTQANWLERTEENGRLILNGTAHIDAAYGGEDCTAYTIMRELRDGRIIAYGHLWQAHVDRCLPEIKAAHQRYMAGLLYCEKNADKGYLATKLRDEYGIPTSLYSEALNKHIKISTYLLDNWSRIWWIADTDPGYIAQILDYTVHADHDDAPDSAACLVRALTSAPRLNRRLRGGV